MRRRELAEPAGSLGLGAWAAFGVLGAVAVGHGGTPLELDRDVLARAVGHRPGAAVAVARGITATGTGALPYVLVAVAALVAGRAPRQRLALTAFGLATLGAGQASRYAVMRLAHRPRPPHPDWATHASGWAFPSGHTTTSALAAGLLIAGRWLFAAGWLGTCLWGAARWLPDTYVAEPSSRSSRSSRTSVGEASGDPGA